ncbi:TIGR03032 family protein [Erythrobacter sp. HL-111]|uniref:TIGR03032 family protein n=1 Tax=Erythrobacter sp. HL-111 TaxID=1798193 RepID=UPI0006D94A3B|nr:TIGR03032 family protein [Erythrobacter sp. HL-111]KPP94425.1 MAG: TIGR03032 family protein [Erythrobacteraceae bacterium HL-111]SDS56117.1 TIGR03032 family protein [Erythrobacter sp. HL-111]
MSGPAQQVAASRVAANPPKADYSLSGGLLSRLASLGVSLAFTSYQSGFLYMLGRGPAGGAQLHQSEMPKPMGLALDGPDRLVLSSRINQLYDACFMPRTQHVTGQLDAHDVGVTGEGEIIFVNTRFNCLATLSTRHSFKPVWKPDFISEIVDEDRCHLNGLAMRDGRPAFVTAVSRSNTIDGWRDRRADGGVVIEVESGKVVCEGLSMPHSPRWHEGRLYVLNAGTGEFGEVVLPGKGAKGAKGAKDTKGAAATGTFRPIAFCPGFLRGLAFKGNYAFVGLSRPRYQRFEGLELDQRLKSADSEAWCGVQVIDLAKGSCVDWFRIDGDIGELYDVELVEGFACPMTVSPNSPDAATLITVEPEA